jgi:hypothetical protein
MAAAAHQTPRSLVALLALFAGACGSNPSYVSPSAPVGPPPFFGPPGTGATAAASNAPNATPPPPPAVEPASLTFYKTQSSSDWVAHNFKVQAKYARVIAVYSGDKPPAKVSVRKLDLDSATESAGPAEELPVTLAVKTLEEAADAAKGGDLVAVLPGHYAGFRLGDKADAGDGRYIHFEALGAPGDVVIDAPPKSDPNWMILLEAAHHVIIQGFNLAGASTPGGPDLRGPNAGILINGDFVHSSKLAHHIAVIGNWSHNHKVWGIHSVDSHTVLVQDNLFGNSGKEHSAYFSDGSDDYVIRRNVFSGSNASGLQVNVDPLASLEKLAKHPALDYPPMQPSRAWALGLLKLATERFGANAFPDGRGFNYLIEDNVINGNGRIGGAAINLAGVRESLIQNNLVYGNLSAGIAEWDNANPFDADVVKPGPQSAAEVTGADVLPIFGCFNNVVRSNTILEAVKGRAALLVGNGSWGTRAYNNVLVNDELPSIELFNTSIWRFEASHNVLDRVSYEGPAAGMKSLATSLPDGPSSVTGVTQQALAGNFVRPGDEPWVVVDGNWWKLNPKRPDFHPRAASALLAGRGDARYLPVDDLEGKKRSKPDVGAYAAAP